MSAILAGPSHLGKLGCSTPCLRPLRSSVLLTTDFPPLPGGISNYLFNVYRQFDLRRMTLIAPHHPRAREFDATQAYYAQRFGTGLGVPGLRGLWQVWRMQHESGKVARRNRNTVLHCGHINAAIAARRLKQRYGTRYLLWTHALEIMDEWLRPTILPAMLDADLVIANSNFTRAFVTSCGVPESRIAKIRPGVDPERFRPGLDASALARRLGVEGRPTLLTVSRIVKANRYKGHDVVLRALPRVVRSRPDLAYLIVGDGDDRSYLQRLATECGVSNNVIFTGHVADADLPLLYNLCDAFIMCSREDRTRRGVLAEGFGISLVEASACGKPVIGGHSGGTTDAVQHGVTGLLVDPVNAEEVANTILQVLREPELRQRFGENGRLWVESEMNWTRAADEFQRAMELYFPVELSGEKGPA